MNLTEDQVDALQELVNIGVGRAAGVLNEMLHTHIGLRVPEVRILSPEDAQSEIMEMEPGIFSAVQLKFTGGFEGSAALAFPPDDASTLVAALTGEEIGTVDLDSVTSSTLCEVGNIVLNSIMGAMTNMVEERIDYALPSYLESKLGDLMKRDDNDGESKILYARTWLDIKEFEIEGSIIIIFEVRSLNNLVSNIDRIIQNQGT